MSCSCMPHHRYRCVAEYSMCAMCYAHILYSATHLYLWWGIVCPQWSTSSRSRESRQCACKPSKRSIFPVQEARDKKIQKPPKEQPPPGWPPAGPKILIDYYYWGGVTSQKYGGGGGVDGGGQPPEGEWARGMPAPLVPVALRWTSVDYALLSTKLAGRRGPAGPWGCSLARCTVVQE